MRAVLNQKEDEMFLLTFNLPFMNLSLLVELPASYCELFDMRFCLIAEPLQWGRRRKAPDFRSAQVPLMCALLHHPTLSHCCFSIVSKRTTQGTACCSPQNKKTKTTKLRVHICRCSFI